MTCKSDNKTFESQMHGVEIESIVTSLAFLLKSVAESHESVDLGGGGFILAVASNCEEGSNQVHVSDHAVVHLVCLAH